MQINYIQNWNINKYKPLNKVNFTAQDPKQPKTFKPYIRRKKSRENIEEKRMLELKNYNIGTRLARIFIYAEKREYEKMLYLIKKDIPPLHAYNIAVDGTDNECARLLMLSKQGINISEHTNLANNEQSYQDLFVKLSKLGARESEISGFYYCSKTQQAKIFEPLRRLPCSPVFPASLPLTAASSSKKTVLLVNTEACTLRQAILSRRRVHR